MEQQEGWDIRWMSVGCGNVKGDGLPPGGEGVNEGEEFRKWGQPNEATKCVSTTDSLIQERKIYEKHLSLCDE